MTPRLTIRLAVLSAAIGLSFPPEATPWGRWQHEVIAEIAEQNLTPGARAAVRKILGVGVRLRNVAVWADKMRYYQSETGPWHYVNYPLELDEPDYSLMNTPEGNVVFAIEEQIDLLEDGEAQPKTRENALKYLIHFVGDLHQPLHCGTGEDSGGNRVPVRWRNSYLNLHKVWDSKIFQKKGAPPAETARELQEGLTPAERKKIMAGSAYDWMVESHILAREVAYGELPRGEKYSKRLRLPELSRSYADKVRPVFERRLLESGLRLAFLLNKIFDRPAPVSSSPPPGR